MRMGRLAWWRGVGVFDVGRGDFMGADFVGFLAVGVAVKCGWPGGRGAAILQVGGSPCGPQGRGGAGALHLPAGTLYRASFASGMEEVSAIAVREVCG